MRSVGLLLFVGGLLWFVVVSFVRFFRSGGWVRSVGFVGSVVWPFFRSGCGVFRGLRPSGCGFGGELVGVWGCAVALRLL